MSGKGKATFPFAFRGVESAREPCGCAGEGNGFFPSVSPGYGEGCFRAVSGLFSGCGEGRFRVAARDGSVLQPVVTRRKKFFSLLLFRFSLLQPIGPALRDGCGKAKVPEGYIFLYFLFLDDDVTTKNVYLCNHIGRICGRCCRLSAVDQGATPFNIVQYS